MNEEQQAIYNLIVNEKKNVFITGGAGVGKSYLINELSKSGKRISKTAMTGSAALQIGGSTLHSWMEIGLAQESAETLAKKIMYSKWSLLKDKLADTDILVIDEVSMMNDQLFTKVSSVLSIISGNPNPFGGLQVVLVGDPFQLSPIEGNYCFMAEHWKECFFIIKALSVNMRQKDDLIFKDMLDRLRFGKCSKNDFKLLELQKTKVFENGVIPTRLFSRNADAERVNTFEFNLLQTPIVIFKTKYTGKDENASRKYAKASSVEENVSLRVGAQVMLTCNIAVEMGLVNGTRGVIENLTSQYAFIKTISGNSVMINFKEVKNDNEAFNVKFKHMPLKLAWAVSIHKSQGLTLDAVEVDLGSSIFANGQAYTGLSRARTLESVKIINVLRKSFKTSEDVLKFWNTHITLNQDTKGEATLDAHS